MKTFITALCATALIATTFVALPTQAKANDVGVGIAAGIIGGVVLGTAIANQPRERVYVEERRRPARVYVEEDEVVCRKVLYETDSGRRYWKRVCN